MKSLEDFESSFQKKYSQKELQNAYGILSDRYRSQQRKHGLTSDVEAAAYAVTRAPATYAVTMWILERVYENLPKCESVLDLGAGTGAATLGFLSYFPDAISHSIEQDPYMTGILKNQQTQLTNASILNGGWPKTDALILSYVTGEMGQNHHEKLMKHIIDHDPKMIMITVPGTPQDYKDLMAFRTYLIQNGYDILAPCPHNNGCTIMEKSNDWCHFSVRFERSPLHKYIKNADLHYEDEKFSYLVALRKGIQTVSKIDDQQSFEQLPEKPHGEPFEKSLEKPIKNPLRGIIGSRIIRAPIKNKGHIILDVCGKNGIKRHTISKKDPNYKRIKKCGWGDDV